MKINNNNIDEIVITKENNIENHNTSQSLTQLMAQVKPNNIEDARFTQLDKFIQVIDDIVRHVPNYYSSPSNTETYKKMFEKAKVPRPWKYPKGNNNIQNATYKLIRTISHSFTDKQEAANKMLSIVSNMKLYLDLCTPYASDHYINDFKPYVFALLNIPMNTNGIEGVLNASLSNYDRNQFSSRSDSEKELEKYGRKVPAEEYLLNTVLDWIWCCCGAENGLYKSVQAMYNIMLSVACYVDKIGKYTLSDTINYVLDEHQKGAYKAIMICSVAKYGDKCPETQYYQRYLECCDLDTQLSLSNDVIDSLNKLVKSALDADEENYTYRNVFKKAKEALTFYRAANDIPLNAELKDLPDEVIEAMTAEDDDEFIF